MAFPAFFKPLATDDMIRVGSPGDGGYVMPSRMLAASRSLLSMGLCDDWSFEAAINAQAKIPVVVFDPSVGPKFWFRRWLGHNYHGLRKLDLAKLRRAWRFFDYRRFFSGAERRHVKLAIGRADHGFVDLPAALSIAGFEKDVLLKCDIEGAEYRILDQIIEMRDRFVGVAMELHEIDLYEDRIARFMAAMDRDFLLVHFHANNCTTFGPADMTIVVEITLMRRSLLRNGEKPAYRPLPIEELDAANLPDAPDIIVQFAD